MRAEAIGLALLGLVSLAGLFFSAPAQAAFGDEPLEYELKGHWFTRGTWIGEPFLGQGDGADVEIRTL